VQVIQIENYSSPSPTKHSLSGDKRHGDHSFADSLPRMLGCEPSSLRPIHQPLTLSDHFHKRSSRSTEVKLNGGENSHLRSKLLIIIIACTDTCCLIDQLAVSLSEMSN